VARRIDAVVSIMKYGNLIIGKRVTVNAPYRHSHGWHGVIDGFSEEVPGQVRVRVRFSEQNLLMTFQPTELVEP
jgi:hypothetical protein